MSDQQEDVSKMGKIAPAANVGTLAAAVFVAFQTLGLSDGFVDKELYTSTQKTQTEAIQGLRGDFREFTERERAFQTNIIERILRLELSAEIAAKRAEGG